MLGLTRQKVLFCRSVAIQSVPSRFVAVLQQDFCVEDAAYLGRLGGHTFDPLEISALSWTAVQRGKVLVLSLGSGTPGRKAHSPFSARGRTYRIAV